MCIRDSLYTADRVEYDVLGGRGWNQEGVVYRTLTAGVYSGVSAIPMYRLLNNTSRHHHWTTDAVEATVLAQGSGWTFEGTSSYLLPTPVAGSVALHRLALSNPSLHLWTTDTTEIQVLVSRGWKDEGVMGYVLK